MGQEGHRHSALISRLLNNGSSGLPASPPSNPNTHSTIAKTQNGHNLGKITIWCLSCPVSPRGSWTLHQHVLLCMGWGGGCKSPQSHHHSSSSSASPAPCCFGGLACWISSERTDMLKLPGSKRASLEKSQRMDPKLLGVYPAHSLNL